MHMISVFINEFSQRRKAVAMFAVGLLCVIAAAFFWPQSDNEDVLRAAYAIPDGGGYSDLATSGVPKTILYDGVMILEGNSNQGSYCCGYTFMVVMEAATARGLLEDAAPYEIKRFQREWYGATKASRLKQVVTAMENLAIGHEVYPLDAQPGDFLVFSRADSGHSVVFLDWVRQRGVIVGIRYRSSQPRTNGVGDATEYFTTSGNSTGSIIPKYVFVARLSS